MLNLGYTELAIIFLIALVVLGPQKLPELGRQLAKALRMFREATDDLKENLMLEERPKPYRPSSPPPSTDQPSPPQPAQPEGEPDQQAPDKNNS